MKTAKPILVSLILWLAGIACSTGLTSTPTPKVETLPATSEPSTPIANVIPPSPTLEVTGPIELAPLNQGPCGNVFYPMVLDQQWVYELDMEDETSKFGMTVSEVAGSKAIIDMLSYETGVTTATDVECDQGAILNFPSMLLGFLFGDVDGTIDLEYVSGVYSPSYDTFIKNNWDYAWEGDYIASGDIVAEIEGDILSATLSDSPLHMSWETTTGDDFYETVEVAAGIYESAIKITRVVTFDASLTLVSEGETIAIQAKVIIESTLWYEPFVGLIKQRVDRVNLSFGGGAFPLESDTEIELYEFYPGG